MLLILDQKDDFAVITINRPESLNALNFQLVRELSDVLDDLETRTIRA